jgi:hypothetical protein
MDFSINHRHMKDDNDGCDEHRIQKTVSSVDLCIFRRLRQNPDGMIREKPTMHVRMHIYIYISRGRSSQGRASCLTYIDIYRYMYVQIGKNLFGEPYAPFPDCRKYFRRHNRGTHTDIYHLVRLKRRQRAVEEEQHRLWRLSEQAKQNRLEEDNEKKYMTNL